MRGRILGNNLSSGTASVTIFGFIPISADMSLKKNIFTGFRSFFDTNTKKHKMNYLFVISFVTVYYDKKYIVDGF